MGGITASTQGRHRCYGQGRFSHGVARSRTTRIETVYAFWVAQGVRPADVVRQQPRRDLEGAVEDSHAMSGPGILDVGCLANLDARPQPYLWQGRIPKRGITLVGGWQR